jgi:hypothetical protein
MIAIGVEGGEKSKIGEARFWVRGLAISPPKISSFERERSRLNFQKKKKSGGRRPTGPPTIVKDVYKCSKLAGNFDDHTAGLIWHKSHRLMKRIRCFMRSHWMPSSGECPRRITPAAAMVIIVGVSKNHNTQLGFT